MNFYNLFFCFFILYFLLLVVCFVIYLVVSVEVGWGGEGFVLAVRWEQERKRARRGQVEERLGGRLRGRRGWTGRGVRSR